MKDGKVDLTFSGKLTTLINILNKQELDVLYTIDGKTRKPTTTSIKIYEGENASEMLMITFDYQELKRIVEGKIK